MPVRVGELLIQDSLIWWPAVREQVHARTRNKRPSNCPNLKQLTPRCRVFSEFLHSWLRNSPFLENLMSTIVLTKAYYLNQSTAVSTQYTYSQIPFNVNQNLTAFIPIGHVISNFPIVSVYTEWFRRSYRHLRSSFLKTFWAKSVI
jgi:hypothetical protein